MSLRTMPVTDKLFYTIWHIKIGQTLYVMAPSKEVLDEIAIHLFGSILVYAYVFENSYDNRMKKLLDSGYNQAYIKNNVIIPFYTRVEIIDEFLNANLQ